ncbi:MAG: selenocysteine-specific translation elongation factor [Planctomycetota bacterium]|nr:MAG: selenocysteine-specific translation elongation factor [Planctomycetota bacterium]
MEAPRPLPVVLGTAGHIDHGKSALIEALCGTHPDRWREEKERGITLDLGYAQLNFEDGLEIGFVDVPGHERLVRKMVAGATGMGAAMLVVSCDDGVMPQTREHFEVLQLLGVKHGLVALSKVDLADEEMVALVHAEVEELLQDSLWPQAPCIPVSAHTGEGLPELRQALRDLALQARSADKSHHAFRLPVQRSFALHGAGTVVTGVCASGGLQEGQVVEVQPGGGRSRVRRIQVHGRVSPEARPGLRTALNLPDLQPEQCPRGTVLVEPDLVRSGTLLRVLVRALPEAPPMAHGHPVQALAGTASVSGRIFLPPAAQEAGKKAWADGASWLVDLELDEAMALVPGEIILIRRPSPPLNLAAGSFLGFGPKRLRRRDQAQRKALHDLAEALGDAPALVAKVLELGSGKPAVVKEVASYLGWTPQATLEALQSACQRGLARGVAGDRYVGMGRAGALFQEVAAVVAHFREKHPHRLRMPVQQIRSRLGKERSKTLEALSAEELQGLGLKRHSGLQWQILDAQAPVEIDQAGSTIAARLKSSGLAPTGRDELSELCPNGVSIDQVLEYLIDSGQVLRPEGELFFWREAVEDLRLAVVAQLQGDGMNIPALRDRFETTRKYLMPLLEFLDHRGVTARRGPNRILRDAEAPLDG